MNVKGGHLISCRIAAAGEIVLNLCDGVFFGAHRTISGWDRSVLRKKKTDKAKVYKFFFTFLPVMVQYTIR